MKKPAYGKLFDGLNVADAILTFLAALGAIAATTRLSAEHPYLLPLVFVVYAAGQFTIVLAAVGTNRIRFNLKNVVALVGLYAVLSCWDLVAIAIGLPFIAITVVLGPLTVVAFVLASVVLGMYALEEGIGYDLRGATSALESSAQAIVASVVWVVSLLVLVWHFGKHDSGDWVMERAGDRIWGLRRQLREMVEDIVQQHGYD